MHSYSLLSAHSKSIKQVSSLKGKEEDYGGSGAKGVFKDTHKGSWEEGVCSMRETQDHNSFSSWDRYFLFFNETGINWGPLLWDKTGSQERKHRADQEQELPTHSCERAQVLFGDRGVGWPSGWWKLEVTVMRLDRTGRQSTYFRVPPQCWLQWTEHKPEEQTKGWERELEGGGSSFHIWGLTDDLFFFPSQENRLRFANSQNSGSPPTWPIQTHVWHEPGYLLLEPLTLFLCRAQISSVWLDWHKSTLQSKKVITSLEPQRMDAVTARRAETVNPDRRWFSVLLAKPVDSESHPHPWLSALLLQESQPVPSS